MRLLNNQGFSLTEALISSALLGAVFLSVALGVDKINTHQNQTAQLQSSELIKNSLYSILNNPKAWENTLNDSSNTVFKCLNSSANCKGKSGEINTVRQSNKSVYFQADGDSGFKSNGKVCKKSIDGESCFLTTKLKVTFLCDGDCKSPLAKIDGNFYLFNSSNQNALNSLNFQMLKSLKTDDCALGCRTEVINPQVTATQTISDGLATSDLKVVMVVDNSSSMKNAQQFLASGLKPLMAKIRSLNIKVQFLIYTTTQFYGEGEIYVADQTRWHRYTDRDGVYKETTGWFNYYGTDFDVEAITETRLRPPVGGKNLIIKPGMSNSEFEDISASVENIVSEQVGIRGGSEEQGLCTVARTLFDTGHEAPFVEGDNVLFLVLTDENDASGENCYAQKKEVRECSDEYNPHGRLKASLCDQSNRATCDRVVYKADSGSDQHIVARRGVYYTCTTEIESDGEILSSTMNRSLPYYYTGRCADRVYGKGVCNDQDIQKIYEKSHCNGDNDVIIKCDTRCEERTSLTASYVDNEPEKTNGANLFSHPFTTSDGKSYSNLLEYFQQKYPDGTFTIEKTSSYGESRSKACEDLPPEIVTFQDQLGIDNEANSLKDAIKQKADLLFGADGYTMSLIINDEELNKKAGCDLVNAQSYGTSYKDLSSQLEIQGTVSSICSSDYSLALENVTNFAEKVASEMKKTITLNEGERVIKITSTSENGGVKTLSSPSDYIIQGLVVTFTDEFIKNNSGSVEVTIGKTPPELKQLQPKWMTSKAQTSSSP